MTTTPYLPIERTTAYIRIEAQKAPLILHGVAHQGYAEVTRAIDEMSEEQAAFRFAEGAESVLDVLNHLIETRRATARICTALASGEAPADIAPRTPAPSLAWARLGIEKAQQDLLAFVDGLWPATNLWTRHDHPAYGALNCKEWVVWQRMHDSEHAAQIAAMMRAPGFPAAVAA